MITVYSISVCPWCDKVKKYLKSRKVEYVEKNIELDETARAECKRISGDLVVPITTADGVNFALSFDKPKLDEIIMQDAKK